MPKGFAARRTFPRRGRFFPGAFATGFYDLGFGWGATWYPDCDDYDAYSGYACSGASGAAQDDPDADEPRPMVIFYTKDGNGFGANDYWQQDGVVHLAAASGGEQTFPLEDLDVKRTAEENAARGVYFALRSTELPATGPQLAANTYTAPVCSAASQQRSGSGSETASAGGAKFGALGERTDRGLRVTSVQPGSHAMQAGIRAGDTITRVGCSDVRDAAELDAALARPAGDTIWVSYLIQGNWLSQKPVRLR